MNLKRIGLLIAMTIAMSLTLTLPAFAGNRNLRNNDGQTMVFVSGAYNFGPEQTHQGASTYVGVTRHFSWVNYGFTAGGDIVNKTMSVKAFVGPKFGSNFYFTPAVSFGLGQSRTEVLYKNPNNGDLWKQNLPQPRFLFGAQARVGYNWEHFGIFAGVSYDRLWGYTQIQNLADPWVEVSRSSQEERLTVELGVAYVFNGKTMKSGSNCPTIAVGGGFSSLGHFTSFDVQWASYPGYHFGHLYGGVCNYYVETGDAEIGARYMLDLMPGPKGWKEVYHFGIGVKAVMGQYLRTWEGVAKDAPERLEVGGQKYSFGGGADLEVVPVALQCGVVNLSLFGSYGFRAITAVKGVGDLNYEANSTSATLLPHWTAGVRVELAF